VSARLSILNDTAAIAAFALRNVHLHQFALADLEPRFRPRTTFYDWCADDQIQQLAMVYNAPGDPVLIAHAYPPAASMRECLHSLLPLLPSRLYAHISHEVVDVVQSAYNVVDRASLSKMALVDVEPSLAINPDSVKALTPADLPALNAFYAITGGGGHFDPATLAAGHVYAIRNGVDILSVAGVHVESPTYGIAVIGNVATHPAHRCQGLASRVCGVLCQVLTQAGRTHIGLNVHSDNHSAIRLYQRLGFRTIISFGACRLVRTANHRS